MSAYEMLMGRPQSSESINRANALALKMYEGELSSIDDPKHRADCIQYFGFTEQKLNKRKKELVKLIAQLKANA